MSDKTTIYRDEPDELGFEQGDAWVKFTREGPVIAVDGFAVTHLDEEAKQHLIAWLSRPAAKAGPKMSTR